MKSMKTLVLAALILLASVVGLLSLAGCKNDSVPEVTPAKRVSITVTPPSRTVYSVGESFDSTGMVVTATYEDGEKRTVKGTITSETSSLTKSAGINKEVTVSYTEGDNTVTATFTVDVASYQFTETVQDYEYPAGKTGTASATSTPAVANPLYKKFGDWPQTIKSADVTVGSGILVRGGLSYHVGSDGNYYVKVTADPYEDGYTYSDKSEVTKDTEVYFKVEPIVWQVLTESYNSTGKALLLAENILTGEIPYYVDRNTRTITGAGTKKGDPDTVYPNNYKYSTIRAWLNGKYEDDDTQKESYTDTGFLQTAFTENAQKEIIVDTEVDNSARSTSDAEGKLPQATDYACVNTTDKIFLLSEQEATMSDYGFGVCVASGQGNTRIRVTTDYAKATGAYQSGTAGYGGWWWLRSPNYYNVDGAPSIGSDGHATSYSYVDDVRVGVVPALSISLQ